MSDSDYSATLVSYFSADETGRITCTYIGTLDMKAMWESTGAVLLEGRANPDVDYWKDGKLTKRPPQATALSGNTLSSLPAPCTICVNATAYTCTDGTADLAFDQPGTYSIRVVAWPYLDKEFSVENSAS